MAILLIYLIGFASGAVIAISYRESIRRAIDCMYEHTLPELWCVVKGHTQRAYTRLKYRVLCLWKGVYDKALIPYLEEFRRRNWQAYIKPGGEPGKDTLHVECAYFDAEAVYVGDGIVHAFLCRRGKEAIHLGQVSCANDILHKAIDCINNDVARKVADRLHAPPPAIIHHLPSHRSN